MKQFKLTDVEGKEFILEWPDELVSMAGVNIKPVEPPAPELKEGMWIIGLGFYHPKQPSFVTRLADNQIWYVTDGGEEIHNEWRYRSEIYVRRATPSEIEAHLKEVCQKYVGKKVRCLDKHVFSTVVPELREVNYYLGDDELWILADKRRICVYKQGRFAEIVPDKRKKPETREEFMQFCGDYTNRKTSTVQEFLDQYHF